MATKAKRDKVNVEQVLDAYGIKSQGLRAQAMAVLKGLQLFEGVMPPYDGELADRDLEAGDLDLVNEYRREVSDRCHECARQVDRRAAEVFEQLVREYHGF